MMIFFSHKFIDERASLLFLTDCGIPSLVQWRSGARYLWKCTYHPPSGHNLNERGDSTQTADVYLAKIASSNKQGEVLRVREVSGEVFFLVQTVMRWLWSHGNYRMVYDETVAWESGPDWKNPTLPPEEHNANTRTTIHWLFPAGLPSAFFKRYSSCLSSCATIIIPDARALLRIHEPLETSDRRSRRPVLRAQLPEPANHQKVCSVLKP